MSPGTFEWYYISVTEHHLLNREGHECEVRADNCEVDNFILSASSYLHYKC